MRKFDVQAFKKNKQNKIVVGARSFVKENRGDSGLNTSRRMTPNTAERPNLNADIKQHVEAAVEYTN